MERDSYQRARQIFHAVCELEGEARERYLDGECVDRPDVRREVESLLAHEQRSAARVLDQPVSGAGALRELAVTPPSDLHATDDAQPRSIGRYRILERIGEGGFGTVFLAEQTEPVVRRVALKVIKPGMDTAQVIARFESERQALARMDHPGIARVIDAGATEFGRPYFVMDLVEGEPLTRYCDRERLALRQRLELFREICGAVQHAHQKGVVHRDLKPSNVLVSVVDGRPLPKVIDFGIAKAIEGRLSEWTSLTAQHQMVGTPQYMSPEQAGAGVDVDTRSDIYSLGVLLYELLCGCTPLDGSRVRAASLPEIQRMIVEEEPLRPSLRLSASRADSGDPSGAELARWRATDEATLARSVRGDLDWIAMKCLEKDRARRYATASALADDIGRHLENELVLARPPSRTYRLQKFVRRNRAAVAAGSASVAALTIATAVSIGFGLSEARQHEQAELAKQRAQSAETAATARADELDRVARFQQKQFEQIQAPAMGAQMRGELLSQVRANAARSLAPEDVDARVKELESLIAGANFTGLALDALESHYFQPARAAIEKQFAGQPVLEARLLQTLATTMKELGLLDAAVEPQRTALEIRRRELGDENLDTIVSIHDTGSLLQEQGKFQQAEASFREALALYRRVLGDDDSSTLVELGTVGLILKIQGDFAGAEAFFTETLEKQRRLLGDDNLDTLVTINNFGALRMAQNRPDDAEPYFRQALEAYRRRLGDDDPNTLLAINNVGGLLLAQGDFAGAEKYHREALEGYRRVRGDRHPDTLMSINNVGYALFVQQKLAEAEPYYREALATRRVVLGDLHPKTLNSMNNLAGLLKEQGKLDEAEGYYRDALEKRRVVLGPDDLDTIGSINNMGWLLQSKGKLEEAEGYYREALERYRDIVGDSDRQTLTAIANLSSVLLERGHAADAVELLAPAEPALREVFTGGNAVFLGRLLALLGRCRAAAKDFSAAEGNLLEAHSILRDSANITGAQRIEFVGRVAAFYDAWETADPDHGHAARAAEWRAKLGEQN